MPPRKGMENRWKKKVKRYVLWGRQKRYPKKGKKIKIFKCLIQNACRRAMEQAYNFSEYDTLEYRWRVERWGNKLFNVNNECRRKN